MVEGNSLDLTGNLAPPMANGELVFDAPWESRVFGMARLLCEQGFYDWDEFREYLIAEVDRWDNENPVEATNGNQTYSYYNLFSSALIRLLEEKQICNSRELMGRMDAFESRPHGHDH